MQNQGEIKPPRRRVPMGCAHVLQNRGDVRELPMEYEDEQ